MSEDDTDRGMIAEVEAERCPSEAGYHVWNTAGRWGEPEPDSYLCRHCGASRPVGTLLAERATHAKDALDRWIVQQREAGRSFRDIAREVGMTPGGVQYVVRKDDR